MNKKSSALVSGLVIAATSFLMPISANSVDIHQVSTQDTPQLLAQGRGRGRDRERSLLNKPIQLLESQQFRNDG